MLFPIPPCIYVATVERALPSARYLGGSPNHVRQRLWIAGKHWRCQRNVSPPFLLAFCHLAAQAPDVPWHYAMLDLLGHQEVNIEGLLDSASLGKSLADFPGYFADHGMALECVLIPLFYSDIAQTVNMVLISAIVCFIAMLAFYAKIRKSGQC